MGSARLYVQYGAGYSAPEGWLSFDASPTLRVQKLPLVGEALAKLSGNAETFPDALLYGDIVEGLPVQAGSVSGLYASHVLEHLSLEDMRTALRNSFTALASGGVFRLIVPDLFERARRYVAEASANDPQAAHRFLTRTYLGKEARAKNPAGRVREMLGNSAHLWMWDYPAMEAELLAAGFVAIRRAKIGDSGDAMFDRIEDKSRFFDGDIEEVAVHCSKL